MRANAALVLALAITCVAVQAGNKRDRRTAIEQGAWSANTVSLFNTWSALDTNPGRRASFFSPDHKKLVQIRDDQVTISLDGMNYPTDLGDKHDAELGWSPDSRRFFVTWSETGELGPWHVQVYEISPDGLRELEGVEQPARRDFDQLIRHLPVPQQKSEEPARSFWKGLDGCEPNVVGSQWLGGSSELLLAVLVPNTGRCRYMSEFYVYRVEVPGGKILQRYSSREAHRMYPHETLPRIMK